MRYKTDKPAGWVNFGKLEEKAEKLRKADPSLSKEQAIARASEQNPDLVERYHREAREDIGGH